MAIVVKTEPEIIEVIDDEGDAFGDSTNHTVYDTGGRRWVGPTAAAALMAVISYGVATSASSSSAPNVAALTSTTIATTTPPPTPTTTVPEPAVPYFAANPPRAFSVRYANIQLLDHAPFTGYGYELWASDGSSAKYGSWFSVTTYRGASTLNAPNAYRVQAGQQSIGISHTPGGQSLAQFTADDHVGVTITSFGWTDDDLVRLAGSVQTDGRSVGYTDDWFMSNHQLITSVQPWLAVQSIPAEQITYASSDEPAASVVITVGKRVRDEEGGTTTDRQTALRFLLDRNTPFEVGGVSAVAGTIIGRSDVAMATWLADDNVFTVTAAMPLPRLISIARTVHQVSSAEWEGMKFQALVNSGNKMRDLAVNIPAVSTGTDADSRQWTIQVAMAKLDDEQRINWQWDGNAFGSLAGDTAKINTVVDNRRTYVLADLPRTVAQTAQLQITRTGLAPVVVPFNGADAQIDRTFAAYAFSEPTTYTAQIIGSDGAVLATWPSS